MARLEGKTILITGGSAGQGAVEARLFSSEGAAIVICDIADEAGERLAAEIQQGGGRARYIHLDVSKRDDWDAAAAIVRAEFGRLDVLVNNAGTISRKNLLNIDVENWQRVLEVNLTGPMLGIQAMAPLMRDSGGGSIINVSSTAGMTAHYDVAYGASKWGVRGLTKCAAMDLVDWNIRVNSIHPGQIWDTTFQRDALPGHWEANWMVTPMGRHGQPDECAQAVLFLASDESSFITGAEIPVDGGLLAAGLMRVRAKLRDEFASGARPPLTQAAAPKAKAANS